MAADAQKEVSPARIVLKEGEPIDSGGMPPIPHDDVTTQPDKLPLDKKQPPQVKRMQNLAGITPPPIKQKPQK